jgi:hypothetical protein
MKFLIQSNDFGHNVLHDFSWTLVQACDFLKWKGEQIEYELSSNVTLDSNVIPIGSVEFVSYHLSQVFNVQCKPINVPEKLNSFFFCKRNVFNGYKTDIKQFPVFVKSMDLLKDNTYILENSSEIKELEDEHCYQISSVIDIISEWRCFVFKGKLVGLQNYSGDFTVFPDVDMIKKIISTWNYECPAYTIDIGINENNETLVIECHDFYSCGLYGFENKNILPYMFSQTYHWLKQHYK